MTDIAPKPKAKPIKRQRPETELVVDATRRMVAETEQSMTEALEHVCASNEALQASRAN